LPEPDPDDHTRVDEADVVRDFVRLWSLVDPTGAAHVRVARQIGDATRRIAEGWLDVWDEVAQPGPTTQGAPTVGPRANPEDPTDPEQNPSIGMSAVARRLVALVHERQVEATLTARIIALAGSGDAVEGYGKAAVVGTAGEVEHASALIHTLRFGNFFRKAVGAKSYLSFTNVRGGPNCSISIPMTGRTPAETAAEVKRTTPYSPSWSVTARPDKPSSAARSVMSSTVEAPCRNEKLVWLWSSA